jgi:hypothetical protein
MNPQLDRPPPPDQFRWTASGTISANNKPDACEQARQAIGKALKRVGGTVTGCAVSNHMELGGRE